MGGTRTASWNGSGWVTKRVRLAIYLRDGGCCAYCGRTATEGAVLSLDHIVPHVHGGTDHHTNLVTACRSCNSSRGAKGLRAWCRILRARGVDTDRVDRFVRSRESIPMGRHLALASKLLARAKASDATYPTTGHVALLAA